MVVGRSQILIAQMQRERRTTNDDFDLLRAPRERQQSDIARLLDRPRETALVRRAHSGQASRSDLAAFRHELRQQTYILVIDRFDLLDAELANFLAPEEFTATFTGASGASAGTWSAWRTAALGAIATTTLRTTFAVA
jgi:hypothetical protein